METFWDITHRCLAAKVDEAKHKLLEAESLGAAPDELARLAETLAQVQKDLEEHDGEDYLGRLTHLVEE